MLGENHIPIVTLYLRARHQLVGQHKSIPPAVGEPIQSLRFFLFAQKKSAINTLSAAMIQKELIAGLLADHFFQVHSDILVIEC